MLNAAESVTKRERTAFCGVEVDITVPVSNRNRSFAVLHQVDSDVVVVNARCFGVDAGEVYAAVAVSCDTGALATITPIIT